MIKELLLSVDISNANSVLSAIEYLYQIMPADPAEQAADEAKMHLDYQVMGDPFNQPRADL